MFRWSRHSAVTSSRTSLPPSLSIAPWKNYSHCCLKSERDIHPGDVVYLIGGRGPFWWLIPGRRPFILHESRRLRAVSYFSLKRYCTRAAINEGVSQRRKNNGPSFLVSSQSHYCNITSWFAIALAEVRTRQISKEKADWTQSMNAEVHATRK